MSPEQATPAMRPRLDARRCAMLAEIGVNVWWQDGAEPAPAEAVRRAARPAAAAPQRPLAPESRLQAAPPAVDRRPAQPPEPAIRPAAPLPIPVVAASTAPRPDLAQADREALEAAIRACNACALGSLRRQAVPGMGDPAPDWLVVGEAPGEQEDRQGLPFVGSAGQLLDRMLAAMHLSRQHKVYIANVIKCRPPQNRNPDPAEIARCEPYLLRQVELLQPRILLAMGRFAAQTLLAHSPDFSADQLRQIPLGKLRGRVHEVEIGGRRLPLVVTYHPAYLLRSPAEKAKSWADLCLALDAFDRLPPRS